MVLIGSCPWPGPWSRTYGAHLQLQAREDPCSNGDSGPAHLYPSVAFFMDIDAAKRELRREALARRERLQAASPEAARRMAENFLNAIPVPPRGVVSAYSAIGE